MLNMLKLWTILAVAFLTVACAGTTPHYVDPAARAHIDEVDAYLAVAQDEIYAEIRPSQTAAAAGGGLLFALIDASVDTSRTKKTEELMQPIRDALIDYDYAEVLRTNILSQLKTIGWLNVKHVELERAIEDNRFIKRLEQSSASAILFMTADYKLAPDFDTVKARISLIMFPGADSLKRFRETLDNNENPTDTGDNIYRNDIIVDMPLGLSGDKQSNAMKLAESKAEILKKALNRSAKQISIRIAEDIELDETSAI